MHTDCELWSLALNLASRLLSLYNFLPHRAEKAEVQRERPGLAQAPQRAQGRATLVQPPVPRSMCLLTFPFLPSLLLPYAPSRIDSQQL